ncbi:MAG: glycosyltransferase family 2 protein [Anaerolineaceae bacterium]|nr:glycosyltransferase family 2 protein [Anaerolineaceae bacterium]
MDNPVYSVIAPIYNEIENLPLLYERVAKVMEQTGESWELILVDDGSKDGSTQMMREMAAQDSRVRPVIFARNFGHQIAATAGMDYSRGKAVMIIDADLQDPPEVMLDLIAKWKEGYEVVYAVRSERQGETAFKKNTAAMFYRFIHKIADVNIPLDTGDFRLLDRKVLDVLGTMREKARFLRGMSAWVGFRQIGVQYKREARHAGVSKYPIKKMLKLAMNAIFGFSSYPIEFILKMGAACSGITLAITILLGILAAFGFVQWSWGLSILLALFFLAGIIFASFGVIGEYITRTYDQVRERPLYIVAEGPDAAHEPTRLDQKRYPRPFTDKEGI